MDQTLTIDGLDLSPPAAGRLLPPGAFTSPAVFDLEMRRIFARSLPAGVPSSFLESRIGHFEQMVSRTLAAEAITEVAVPARPSLVRSDVVEGS